MKNDNEAKMKEILDELEDELLSGDLANKEEIEELEVKPARKNKKKYEFDANGIVVGEEKDSDAKSSKYKFSKDGIVIGESDEKINNKYTFDEAGVVVDDGKKKTSKKKKYKFDSAGIVVSEYDDDALEVEYEFDEDGFVVGQSNKKEKMVEDEQPEVIEDLDEEVIEPIEEETKEEPIEVVEEKEEEKNKKDIVSEIDVKESPIRSIGNYIIEKLKKYKYVIILNVVVFLFLFFLIPAIILEVKPVVWMTLFLVFTILPTVAFYLGRLFQKYQILFSIPFFYLCILGILDNCTIKDLYGITSHGGLDRTPAWIDAILVMFIIVFFQYLGLCVIDLARKYLKKGKNKDDKKEVNKKSKKDKKNK